MERDRLVERAARLSEQILSKLHELKSLEIVGDVRGVGFMYGIELVENKETKEPLNPAVMADISSACEKKGLLIATDQNIIRINPPLVSTEDDLHFLVDTLTTSLQEVRQ